MIDPYSAMVNYTSGAYPPAITETLRRIEHLPMTRADTALIQTQVHKE